MTMHSLFVINIYSLDNSAQNLCILIHKYQIVICLYRLLNKVVLCTRFPFLEHHNNLNKRYEIGESNLLTVYTYHRYKSCTKALLNIIFWIFLKLKAFPEENSQPKKYSYFITNWISKDSIKL